MNTGMLLDIRWNRIHNVIPIIRPFLLNNLCGIIMNINDSINISESEYEMLLFVQKFSVDMKPCSSCGDSMNMLDIISDIIPMNMKNTQYFDSSMNVISSSNLSVMNIILY